MSQANLDFPESTTSSCGQYRGRFASSPTGSLHIGLLITALVNWLDTRVHGGAWLVCIEDTDFQRNVPGAGRDILAILDALGLIPDKVPQWQSTHLSCFEQTLEQLQANGNLYPYGCTRREIADFVIGIDANGYLRHQALIHLGTCRNGLHGRPPRA